MVPIPVTQQYYPSVPLSELSDLYSKGDNRLDGKRAFIMSYLPKVLRVNRQEPFNNKYFLFIENTTAVQSISWEYELFLRNQIVNDKNTYTRVSLSVNNPEFEIIFIADMVNTINTIVYDKLIVKCTFKSTVQNTPDITMSIEHSFIQGLDSLFGLNRLPTDPRIPNVGDPRLTNRMVNLFKDYLTPDRTNQNNVITESLNWNHNVIENDATNLTILLKVVAASFYSFEPNPVSYNLTDYFDLNSFTNLRIKMLINSNTNYDGDYKNGICNIPLHILGDIISDISQVPNFTTVDDAPNNAVFNLINDHAILVSLGLDELLRPRQSIQDSKQRLTSDIPKMVELFNLTLFPKSAIKLMAILIKYLFTCSQKNNCNECYKKSASWTTLPFNKLDVNQDFLKNILTHYYDGPVNKITKYSKKAIAVNKLVWSPGIDAIINLCPRITRVYFAKKIVTKQNEIIEGAITPVLVYDFERIDNTITRFDQNSQPLNPQPLYDLVLGGKIYLVVETLNCRNKKLTVNIKTDDVHLTGNADDVLSILSGRDDMSTSPADYRENIERLVGHYDDLRNNNNDDFNNKEKEFYSIDHRDRVVIKLRLRGAVANFDNWANTLAEHVAALKVSVQINNQPFTYYGNHITDVHRDSGEFLSTNDPYQVSKFRVVNRIVYEIYQDDRNGSWNYLPNLPPARINRRRLGKISNLFMDRIDNDTPNSQHRKAVYLYYDHLDNEHFVCEAFLLKIRRKHKILNIPAIRGNAIPPVQTSFAVNRNSREKIDAVNLLFYENGTLSEGGAKVPQAPLPIPANINNITASVWYENVSQNYDQNVINADIVLDPQIGAMKVNGLNYNKSPLEIRFTYQHTRRRYANPDLFAGLIGALAQQNFRSPNLVLNSYGFSFQDGSCYPSVEHVDGKAIDVDYFPGSDGHVNTQDFINDMFDFGFRRFRVGFGMIYNHGDPDAQPVPPDQSLHASHLHCTNFNTVVIDNQPVDDNQIVEII
jgi:hypothetical protein